MSESMDSLRARIVQLEAENQALREFVKYSPGANTIIDAQLNYIAASDTYLETYNIGEQLYQGMTLYEAIPDMPQVWKDRLARVQAGAIESADMEQDTTESDYRRWELRPWYDAEGKMGGVILYEEVVTERVKAQQRLQQFKAVVETTTDGIILTNLDGHIEYTNLAYLDMLGYTLEELQQIELIDTVEITPEEFQKTGEKIFEQGSLQDLLTYKRKDGSTFKGQAVTIVLKDEQGNPTSLVASVRDVTEQERMAEAIRESEKRNRWLLNNLPGLIITIFDKDYRVESIDGRDFIDSGLQKEDVEGKLLVEAFGPEIYGQLKPFIDRALAGESFKVDSQFGETIYETLYMPYETQNDDGEISKVVSLAINISETRRMAAEQERLQQEIIDAQKQALKELSTPIIPLFEGVLVMPLIGSIDTARSRDIMRNLLAGINEHRAKTVIVDITGVPLVDTGVADHLNKTIQAARLKGAHTIVTGISDAVAETIVDLGIDWSEVQTMSDLQSGLLLALERRNISLS